jgi:Flp pilus assembly protein TadD
MTSGVPCRRRAALALSALLLSACASGALQRSASRGGARPSLTPADAGGVQMAMIETMLQERHWYAALAHLDALDEGLRGQPRAVWLRAEALRRTERAPEAARLYRTLLPTDWAGPAHRGLGLIAAQTGDLDTALSELGRARELRPTDGRIRNDLGYALLLDGRVSEARIELATAMDLDEPAGTRNMLLLLLATGDEAGARELLQQHSVAERSQQEIQAQAARIVERWEREVRTARDLAEDLQTDWSEEEP